MYIFLESSINYSFKNEKHNIPKKFKNGQKNKEMFAKSHIFIFSKFQFIPVSFLIHDCDIN